MFGVGRRLYSLRARRTHQPAGVSPRKDRLLVDRHLVVQQERRAKAGASVSNPDISIRRAICKTATAT